MSFRNCLAASVVRRSVKGRPTNMVRAQTESRNMGERNSAPISRPGLSAFSGTAS